MTYGIMFSVVIPVYNRSTSILPTLLSVQSQSYPHFECIVVDDGSEDGVLLENVVSGLLDARFKYIRRHNGGGGAARNSGIDEAKGDYIAFLDSDDLFLSHKLAVIAGNLPKSPLVAIYSLVRVDRGQGRVWTKPSRGIRHGEDMGEYLFTYNEVVQTSSIVIASEVARRVRFDPELRKGQDLDFCIRLHAAGVRFELLAEELVIWTDISEVNRTSRTSGYEAPILWLEKVTPLLTPSAIRGYRATVLSYYMAKERPLTAVRYLVGGLAAGVPPKIVARHAIRCFLPRSTYRTLVNAFVAMRGNDPRAK